jgi:hypothetical protein
MNLNLESGPDSFLEAVDIALEVRFAHADDAPIPATVMHFYSPVSMRRNQVPRWIRGGKEIAANLDRNRFRLYEGIQ